MRFYRIILRIRGLRVKQTNLSLRGSTLPTTASNPVDYCAETKKVSATHSQEVESGGYLSNGRMLKQEEDNE